MKNILLFILVLTALSAHAQLPNCSGADSNCLFLDGGSTIYRYDPALPISATNPSIFLTSPSFGSGLTICNNINGGAASPTFYTTSGSYEWWNGSAWVNTGHNSSTVNIGGGTNFIYGKEGFSGALYKYDGTGNDVFLVNGFGNSGPYDLVVDAQDNFYEIDISSTIGYIYKRNPSGTIIDTLVILNVPPQGAGAGFGMIGNKVYVGVNTAPSVWSGTIINDTINATALGNFGVGYGDFATCPFNPTTNIAASFAYPTCTGPITVNISSTFLTAGATTQWNFGDPASGINNISNLTNPTHTFSGNGTYTVTVIITNSVGSDTVTNTVVINNIILGNSAVSICAPNTFQGHSTSGTYIDTFAISPICDSIHTLVLTVNPQPVPNLGPDALICGNVPLILNAGPGFSTYLWDDLSIGQTRTVSTPGTYYVTVTSAFNCVNTDTINVLLDTTLNADFSIIIKLGCENDTITCVNNSTGASQYVWFFGDSQFSTAVNPTHVYQGQAVYNVTLIASNPPCADTMVIPIDLNHPINADIYVYGSLPAPQLVKEDTTCVLYKLNAQSLSFPVGAHLHEFNWGDGTISNTLNNPYANHLYSKGGTYFVTLTITDTIGCKDSVTKKVFVDDVAFVDFTISDSVVCIGTPIVFKDTLSPFTISWDYDFGDGSGVDNMHNPIHTYDNENNFIVTLTAKNLICPDSSKSKSIVVDDYPRVNLGKDTSICPGLTGTIILTNLENTSGVYEWSTGEITNAINVVNAGRYWVKAQSANAGCESVDSIWVTRDCYINIPNAFSPDGDGRNDYFFPRELLSSNLKSFRMNIYNRWGENIFTTDKIDGRGWDGKYNGKPQPMGSYVYIIDCEFNNFIKKNFKGNVTLVR